MNPQTQTLKLTVYLDSGIKKEIFLDTVSYLHLENTVQSETTFDVIVDNVSPEKEKIELYLRLLCCYFGLNVAVEVSRYHVLEYEYSSRGETFEERAAFFNYDDETLDVLMNR